MGGTPLPGALEPVRRMGVAADIEQQLNPEKLDKNAVEACPAGMETLRILATGLFANCRAPAFLDQLERRLAVLAGTDPEANPHSLSLSEIGNSG